MQLAVYDPGTSGVWADALFVSVLQGSEKPDAGQIHKAIATAVCAYGGQGCAQRVAQPTCTVSPDRKWPSRPAPRAGQTARPRRCGPCFTSCTPTATTPCARSAVTSTGIHGASIAARWRPSGRAVGTVLEPKAQPSGNWPMADLVGQAEG